MLKYRFSQWWNYPYKDHIKNVNNIGQNLKEIKNSPFWHCRSLCEQLPSWLPTLCFHSTRYGDWSRTLDTLDDERQMIFYNTNNENQNYSLINCNSHPLIKWQNMAAGVDFFPRISYMSNKLYEDNEIHDNFVRHHKVSL